MKISNIKFFIIITLLASACGTSVEEVISTSVATTSEAVSTKDVYIQNAIEATIAFNISLITATPTITPTPNPTSTLIPTITPTLVPVAEIITELVEVRKGPGYPHPILVYAELGTQYPIIGLSIDASWLIIELEKGYEGWVLIVNTNFKTLPYTLPIINSPPTPTPEFYSLTIENHLTEQIFFAYANYQPSKLLSGQIRTFKIPSGFNDFRLYLGNFSNNCPTIFNQYVNHNLYWIATVNNFCGSFPP